ncbi:MAG: hypothetical protein WC503_01890 [Candidatus Shapirobacteria bacterium]
MPEINTYNGVVKYSEGERIKSTDELLAGSTVVGGMGLGFERKPKATDLSPVKPKRAYDAEGNEIVVRMVMDYPLNKFPQVRRESMPFLTPVL